LKRKTECAACIKYSVLTVVEKIYKMQVLEESCRPVLYIGRTVLKGYMSEILLYPKGDGGLETQNAKHEREVLSAQKH
jgi:hypothetical protein